MSENNKEYTDDIITYFKNELEEHITLFKIRTEEKNHEISKVLSIIGLIFTSIIIIIGLVTPILSTITNQQIALTEQHTNVLLTANSNHIQTTNYSESVITDSSRLSDEFNKYFMFLRTSVLFVGIIMLFLIGYILFIEFKYTKKLNDISSDIACYTTILSILYQIKVKYPDKINNTNITKKLTTILLPPTKYREILLNIIGEFDIEEYTNHIRTEK